MRASALRSVAVRLFALLLLGSSLAACDALNESPPGEVSPANFYQNASDVETAVNGIYAPLASSGYELWQSPAWLQVICEDDIIVCENWMPGNAGQFAGPTGTEWFAGRPWTGYYNIIARTNSVIENVNEMEEGLLTTDQRNRALGQAYFMRGYSYFELARNYGDAPIRRASYDPTTDGYGDIPRSPVSEVYQIAVSDMKRAEEMLPASYGGYQRGRPVSVAAAGMLSKFYLFMAGERPDSPAITDDALEGNADAYYDSTAMAAQRVMDQAGSGFPSLEADYHELFSVSSQDESDEILFSIQLSGVSEGQGAAIPQYFAPPQFGLAGGGARGFSSIRPEFVESFPEGDRRVLRGPVSAGDTVMIFDEWTTQTRPDGPTFPSYYVPDPTDATAFSSFPEVSSDTTQPVAFAAYMEGGTTYGYNTYLLPGGTEVEGDAVRDYMVYAYGRLYTSKYVDASAPTLRTNGANPIILRYAEVLLNYAEAEAMRSGGSGSEAIRALNQLRERAEAPDIEQGLSGTALRDTVWAERQRELYAEFHRRYDLIRQGRYLDIMNGNVETSFGVTVQSRERSGFQQLFPLPSGEISSNQEIATGNPGY